MSKRLAISEWESGIVGAYPREAFVAISKGVPAGDSDLLRFVRLWITEGIPFCFQDRPAVYERVREYVANRLELRPRDVSMTGSGRIGFSLSPQKHLRIYRSGSSDIDFFVVSELLFNELASEFSEGMALWASGKLPASPKRAAYLSNKQVEVPRQIGKGFIDTHKIPVWRGDDAHFVLKRKCASDNMLQGLSSLLMAADDNERFRIGSPLKQVRVYESWEAAISQNFRNVQSLAKKLASGHVIPN